MLGRGRMMYFSKKSIEFWGFNFTNVFVKGPTKSWACLYFTHAEPIEIP